MKGSGRNKNGQAIDCECWLYKWKFDHEEELYRCTNCLKVSSARKYSEEHGDEW